jgi:hypothetical protein
VAERRHDIRQKGFRLGDNVKLHDLEQAGGGNAYPFPPGWSDEQPVAVVAFDRDYGHGAR